jgi:hypothetical protein
MMKTKKVMAIGLTMVLLLVSVGIVTAEKPPEIPEELENAVRQVDPYTFVSGDRVPDKKAFVAAWEASEEAARGDVGTLAENSGTDTATKNILGSYIEGETYFHGILESGLTTVTFTGDGHTKGWWWGSNPWNADRLTLDSEVVITGISVSISVPPGAGFSVSGNTATYSGTWDDVWWAAHYYENLEATSHIAITDQDQNDAETFRFGNEDHTLYTHVDL